RWAWKRSTASSGNPVQRGGGFNRRSCWKKRSRWPASWWCSMASPWRSATHGSNEGPSFVTRTESSLFALELADDDQPLDLVGALEDLHDLGLAKVSLDRNVTGVPSTAEHL